MQQPEVNRIVANTLNVGETAPCVQAAQRIALQVAQLALEYSEARGEGRLSDAKVIKAEALYLKAEQLGIEYSLFVAQYAAFASERNPLV